VVITSQTNTAIDEVLRRIALDQVINEERVVRVGEMSRGMIQYSRFFLKQRVLDAKARFRAGNRPSGYSPGELGEYLQDFEEGLFAKAQVVLGTVSSLGRESLRHVQATFLLVDEAGQTVESSIFQALRAKTETAVLIGDPNQLEGHTELPEKYHERFHEHGRRHKLMWGVLRAIEYAHRPFPGITLRTQYRTATQIGLWLEGFYEYQVYHKGRDSYAYLANLELSPQLTMGQNRLALVSCEGVVDCGLRNTSVRQNAFEAARTIDLLLRISAEVKFQGEMRSVAVITPYNEQAALVRQFIERSSAGWRGVLSVTVTSVDSSQATEFDITIVSMVRNDGSIGFMRNHRRRTLVALSRVRDYGFVLVHRPTYQSDTYWSHLFDRAKQVGALEVVDETPLSMIQDKWKLPLH
jgi:hypothetical protein